MKRGMVLFLTLVLMAAMAVTNANAQQYVHTDTLGMGVSIAFKDNGTLISGDLDDSLRAWDVTTGTQRWRKSTSADQVYNVVLPSHDPSFIAYRGWSNYDIQMRYSDDGDWRGRNHFKGQHTGRVRSLAFKPNSYLLASGSQDNTIRIWDMEYTDNLRHVRTMQGQPTSCRFGCVESGW